MQCMSVDLPEPDGPMTAVKRPRSNVDVDPGQRVDRRLPGAVGLAQAHRPGGRAATWSGGTSSVSATTPRLSCRWGGTLLGLRLQDHRFSPPATGVVPAVRRRAVPGVTSPRRTPRAA